MNIKKEELIKKNSIATLPLSVKLLSLFLLAALLIFLGYFFFADNITAPNITANDILNSKIQRISFLQEAEIADKKKIEDLKNEIVGLKKTMQNVQRELKNINSSSVVSVQYSRTKIYDMLKNAANPKIVIATTTNNTIINTTTKKIVASTKPKAKKKAAEIDKIKLIKREAYNINF
jgi:Tfp pilus assembly protein PilN